MMTAETIYFSFTVFTSFFAIMNPIANIPIFIGLTKGQDEDARQKTAGTCCLVAFTIIAISASFGTQIFELFGINIAAFKITGGLLIFYVGSEMLMSKQSSIHDPNNNQKSESSIAISPLAVPLLAGPGTIVTAMDYANDSSRMHFIALIFAIGFVLLLNYTAFTAGNHLLRFVGKNLVSVIGKLMGLIVAVIGTGMFIEGTKLAFNL